MYFQKDGNVKNHLIRTFLRNGRLRVKISLNIKSHTFDRTTEIVVFFKLNVKPRKTGLGIYEKKLLKKSEGQSTSG